MGDETWNYWNQFPEYGDMQYKRAIGDLDEMESSKSLSNIIQPIYQRGMKVLDVACGAGHYFRSFKNRIDDDINFTGVDITPYYIELANKAYGDEARFSVDDIYALDFNDEQFDIVTCNNTILALPPPPTTALAELIRVSSKYVIVRTLVSKCNYIIKKVWKAEEMGSVTSSEKDLITADGELPAFDYTNMYTKNYFRQIINEINPELSVTFKKDTDFSSFNNTENIEEGATKVINDMQVAGNLIFDYNFIIIEK